MNTLVAKSAGEVVCLEYARPVRDVDSDLDFEVRI